MIQSTNKDSQDILEITVNSQPAPIDYTYLMELRDYKLAAYENSYTALQVKYILDISNKELLQLVKSNKILSLKEGKDYCYPKCQFYANKLIYGLDRVLAELSEFDSWMKLQFLTTGDIRLDENTPLDYLLSTAYVDNVVWAAKCYGNQGCS